MVKPANKLKNCSRISPLIYQRYISLDHEFWLLAALMGVMIIFGTWSAKRLIDKMPVRIFQRFVLILLIIIALYMIIHG